MPDFEELNWEEAMRRGHAALLDSEHLYDDINAAEGRSNLDIEKHLPRSEVKAAHAQVRLALARELGNQAPLRPSRHLIRQSSTSYCFMNRQPSPGSCSGGCLKLDSHSRNG